MVNKDKKNLLVQRVALLERDVFMLTQVVRQNRAVLQYIANRDATVDSTITVSPRSTGSLRSGVSATITTNNPLNYVPITTPQLYEHLFDSQVVP